jgi:hypothetical protein
MEMMERGGTCVAVGKGCISNLQRPVTNNCSASDNLANVCIERKVIMTKTKCHL